jgi:hypothetical protein
MNSAEAVARRLTAWFLEQGSFVSAVPMSSSAVEKVVPAAAGDENFAPVFDSFGFAGLAVQAVGYEEGPSERRVHVYVAKGSRKAIESVPTSDGDVDIEVNRVGKLIVRPEQASAATNRGNLFIRKNRIACGSSCAPSGEMYSGTLGAIVRKTDKRMFILSNNHVLAACNHTPVGMPIMSPSNADSSPNLRAPSEIAKHSEICELRSGVPALVAPLEADVAIARLEATDGVTSWQGDANDGYDTPRSVIAPKSAMRVKKFGRTTGLTTGELQAAIVLLPLPYKFKLFSATVYFRDVWTILSDGGTSFALPGDSGSLVVTEDGKHAVGLIFAAGQDYGFMIPMRFITGCFGGISLVDKHGV